MWADVERADKLYYRAVAAEAQQKRCSPKQEAKTDPVPKTTGALNLSPFARDILAAHNAAREAVGTPALKWNPVLEEHATARAQEMARLGKLVHAPREGRGTERENILSAPVGYSPERMMKLWSDESRHFRPGLFPDVSDTGNWADVAHYTQMVWATTTNIGCGIARGSGFDWMVCRYDPGGNKDGKPVIADSETLDRLTHKIARGNGPQIHHLDCKGFKAPIALGPNISDIMNKQEQGLAAQHPRECPASAASDQATHTSVKNPGLPEKELVTPAKPAAVPDTRLEHSIVDERPALTYMAAVDRFQDARQNCRPDAANAAFADMTDALVKQRALVQVLTEGGEFGNRAALKVATLDLKKMEEAQPRWSRIRESEMAASCPINTASDAEGKTPVKNPGLPEHEVFTPAQPPQPGPDPL